MITPKLAPLAILFTCSVPVKPERVLVAVAVVTVV